MPEPLIKITPNPAAAQRVAAFGTAIAAFRTAIGPAAARAAQAMAGFRAKLPKSRTTI